MSWWFCLVWFLNLSIVARYLPFFISVRLRLPCRNEAMRQPRLNEAISRLTTFRCSLAFRSDTWVTEGKLVNVLQRRAAKQSYACEYGLGVQRFFLFEVKMYSRQDASSASSHPQRFDSRRSHTVRSPQTASSCNGWSFAVPWTNHFRGEWPLALPCVSDHVLLPSKKEQVRHHLNQRSWHLLW